MQFVLDNGIHKIIRITGPKHNFLGIRLSDEPSYQTIKVISLPLSPYSNIVTIKVIGVHGCVDCFKCPIDLLNSLSAVS